MLEHHTICQAPLSPYYIYQKWSQLENSDLADFVNLLLTSQTSQHEKVCALLFLLLLDRDNGKNISRTNKEHKTFDIIKNKINLWPATWPIFFQTYHFRKVRKNVYHALHIWAQYPERAIFVTKIPSPLFVLEMQSLGKRPIGGFNNWQNRHLKIQDKENSLNFLLHDLEHLYHFIDDINLYTEQVGFFGWIKTLMKDHPLWKSKIHEWHYLISDMTTHPAHSYAYFCALLINLNLKDEKDWAWRCQNANFSPEITQNFLASLSNINTDITSLRQHWQSPRSCNSSLT